jgi:hypothetical protein
MVALPRWSLPRLSSLVLVLLAAFLALPALMSAQTQTPLFPVTQFSNPGGDGLAIVSGDFNGDGQADLAYLTAAVRRRELDAILVWRLDRWGRSLPDLVITIKELAELGVGFVSLTEAF